MELKWIDEKSVLKIGKELFKAGDIVPDEELTEKRIELFESLGQIERTIPAEEKPKRKSRKKKKPSEEGEDNQDVESEEAEENAGPKE